MGKGQAVGLGIEAPRADAAKLLGARRDHLQRSHQRVQLGQAVGQGMGAP